MGQVSSAQYDEQLRQLQKIDVIGRLTAGIAHDFNNVLTAVLGYADLLQHSVEPSAQLLADIAEIRRAAQRGAGLTRQILAFTRQDVPETELIDVDAVATDVSRMLTRVIGEDIELTVACGAAPSRVLGNASQMEQVLLNLVVNARDAMPGGGRIGISTRPFVADGSFAAAHPGVTPGRYLALEVADNGPGMADDVLAHIFDPFFTTKGETKGTGLGLAIVASIVAQNSGHILVDSAIGRGSRFTILLPSAGEAAHESPAAPVERRQCGGRATILLVEDEDQVRSLAVLCLRRYGYTVHEAADGEQALSLVAEGLIPDLLITDVVMPSLGGALLAESIRAAFPSLKVLYMSGYPDRHELQSRGNQPGVGFLQKPFPLRRLLDEVRGLLTWSAAERRIASRFDLLPPPPAKGATTKVAPGSAAVRAV